MQTFNFGDPRLFVMGTELTMFDPATGNVVGYDNIGSDSAINYTFDLTEVVGGMQNQLVGLIPHTTRLTGTYTSQAFSLSQRALLTGGTLSNNAVVPVCETITASGSTLTVTNVPAKAQSQPASDTLAWCQVRVHGAESYEGTNYGVDMTTKQVQNFTATASVQYDVFYFTVWASGKQLALPGGANPSIVSIHQKWAVYAEQNGTRSQGTLQGYLYVIVPRAMLNGDAGVNGNQTTNSTTTYSWRAIMGNDNMPICDDCDGATADIAYYVYVPCGNEYTDVVGIVVVGGDMTMVAGTDAQLNIKLLYKDGTIATPTFTELTYLSATQGVATISSSGVVHAVAQGTSNIMASYLSGGKTIIAKTTVTVTAA